MRPENVCLCKDERTKDTAIDMRFSRKMDDGIDRVCFDRRSQKFSIANVAADKVQTVCEVGEILGIAGIGQFVKVDDAIIVAGDESDEIASDETCSARYENIA